jgi:hypothetical protein
VAGIYVNDDLIGRVDPGGSVIDFRRGEDGTRVGSVSSSGKVEDLNGRVGEVTASGQVWDLNGRVGEVSLNGSVEDLNGSVGTVGGDTTRDYGSGITEMHKAGAALLLLLVEPGQRQVSSADDGDTWMTPEPATPPVQKPIKQEDEPRISTGERIKKKIKQNKIVVGLLALVVLGAGSYAIYSVTSSGSASRLSLPGISVVPPEGWTSYPVNESGVLSMAPPGAESGCPNTPSGGGPRCIDGVTIYRNLEGVQSGDDPEGALQQLASIRFNALRASIRNTTVLTRNALTIDGCPAYLTEWRVSWIGPPDTIEGWVTIRTNTAYQNSYLAAVFIRFSAQDNNPSQMLMAIVSSIMCD